MFDLSNITNNNGWAISIFGILIVFSALVLISFAVSQIHKLLALWDQRDAYLKKMRSFKETKEPLPSPEKKSPPFDFSRNIQETARQFKLLVNFLGQPFSLPDLLMLAQSRGIDRPHYSLYLMLQHHFIVPDEKGFYIWNQETSDRA